jgi:4'-phosphopantetheinyl transferase
MALSPHAAVMNLPDAVSHRLNICRGEAHLEAMLVVAFESNIGSWDKMAAEVLGPVEAAYFSSLRFERRQKSYLLGRYAAKLALKEALSEPDLKSIQILKGVFEQPIVHCKGNSGWSVTISHADSLAVGLAYPAGHPMGVDLERIDPTRYEAILSQLSQEEINWSQSGGADRYVVATALWTAKEALSKVLTTGLMTPARIYDLAEFGRAGSGVWEGLFQNFAQYKAKVWIGSSYALSIVMPKRSMFCEVPDLCSVL